MKSNLQPIPQPILPSNVGKGGLDDLNLVATGQQVLAVHPFFSTAKIKKKIKTQYFFSPSRFGSPVLQGFINLNDSQIIFKAIATHEDWLGILVCTPGKGIKKIFSEN